MEMEPCCQCVVCVECVWSVIKSGEGTLSANTMSIHPDVQHAQRRELLAPMHLLHSDNERVSLPSMRQEDARREENKGARFAFV